MGLWQHRWFICGSFEGKSIPKTRRQIEIALYLGLFQSYWGSKMDSIYEGPTP